MAVFVTDQQFVFFNIKLSEGIIMEINFYEGYFRPKFERLQVQIM